MGPITAISACFGKYAWFGGRATRLEYWWFWLFYVVSSLIPIVGPFISLASVLPMLAVSWRRMHDIGMSGWWVFLPAVTLIPTLIILNDMMTADVWPEIGMTLVVVGLAGTVALSIMTLVWLASPSEPADNAFGENPHGPTFGLARYVDAFS